MKHTVEAETQRSERTDRSFAILVFDLDALKEINDRYGHVVGNRALCRLSATLRLSCRAIDTPTRCGGDEFAVVLPEAGAREAGLTARRICVSLADDREEPHLSVSVGIAVYPHDGMSLEGLLRTADCGLYKMKEQRSRVPPASPDAAALRAVPASARRASGGRSRQRPIRDDYTED